MQKLIEGAKLIKEVVQSDSIIGMEFDKKFNQVTMKQYIVTSVHVHSRNFKEIVEDLNIIPCYVEVTERNREDFEIELEVCHEGVYFFTLMSEHEYEAEFREWIYEEVTDEEFVTDTPRGVTSDQVKMKEVGMNLYRDFL